ncbi:hypothetical protein TRVL_01729 [Trypanosoma vivax]|nr:hypothetical protein TRVL_01729 [Trypanosoma vivax]
MLIYLLPALIAVVLWVLHLRLNSPHGGHLYRLVTSLPDKWEADYVVIGAGPGGLAAARCLLEHEPRCQVLVIERGEEACPPGILSQLVGRLHVHDLLSYAPESARFAFGQRHSVPRPLYKQPDEESEALRHSTYLRGCGVGGTALVDWALYFQPLPIKAKRSSLGETNGAGPGDAEMAQVVPHRFAVTCNPLSWAFASSAFSIIENKHLPTLENPQARNSTFPALLRIEPGGRRLPLSSYVLRALPPQLTVLTRSEVVDMTLAGEGKVVGVHYRAVSQRTLIVGVRRGVVLSCGVIGTARLVRQVFPNLQKHFLVRDAISLPLIFHALPKLTDDRHNIHNLSAHLALLLGRHSPLLNAVCNTVATKDIPSLGPEAELVIFMLPIGGRNPTVFEYFGFDRCLGAFAEGFTMLMALRGVDGAVFEAALETRGCDDTPPESGVCPTFPHAKHSPFPGLAEDLTRKVITALVEGMLLCRRVVSSGPLNFLTSGQEAVDVTLLTEPQRALQYVQLLHTPGSKLTARQRSSAHKVLAWAKECAATDSYMESYIRRHASWLGFGSGSCADGLHDEQCFRLSCAKNVVIGDCSAVTETLWKASSRDTLRAGSVPTAMAVGRAAALELLST